MIPIIPIIAGVAGVVGAKKGIDGVKKITGANKKIKEAKNIQEKAKNNVEAINQQTIKVLDEVGAKELEILSGFDTFADLIEKIQGRPTFEMFKRDDISIPEFSASELKEVSVAAKTALANVVGAAVGYAGAYAATDAVLMVAYSAVSAATVGGAATLTTAEAGTAMLATIGGGEAVAGALILEGLSWGVGILLAGFVIDRTGEKLGTNAEKSYEQALKISDEASLIYRQLNKIKMNTIKFKKYLLKVEKKYDEYLSRLQKILIEKNQWKDFTTEEKKTTENLVLLVGLLYKMCKTQLIIKGEEKNEVNENDIKVVIGDAKKIMDSIEV